jgi:hypothetical protein
MSLLYNYYATDENIYLIGYGSNNKAYYDSIQTNGFYVTTNNGFRLFDGRSYTRLNYDPYNDKYVFSFKAETEGVDDIDNCEIYGGSGDFENTVYGFNLSRSDYVAKKIEVDSISGTVGVFSFVAILKPTDIQLKLIDTKPPTYLDSTNIKDFSGTIVQAFLERYSFKIRNTVKPGRYKIIVKGVEQDTLYNFTLDKPVITNIEPIYFVKLEDNQKATFLLKVDNYNIINNRNFLTFEYKDSTQKFLNINNTIEPYITYDKDRKEFKFTLNSKFNKINITDPDILLRFSNGFSLSEPIILKSVLEDLAVPVLTSISPPSTTQDPYLLGQTFTITGSNLRSEVLEVLLTFPYSGGAAADTCTFTRVNETTLIATIPTSLSTTQRFYHLRLRNQKGLNVENRPIEIIIFNYPITGTTITPNKFPYTLNPLIKITGENLVAVTTIDLSKDGTTFFPVKFIFYFSAGKYIEFRIPLELLTPNTLGTYDIYFNRKPIPFVNPTYGQITLETDKITIEEIYVPTNNPTGPTLFANVSEIVQPGYSILLEGEGYEALSYLEIEPASGSGSTVRINKDDINIVNDNQLTFNLPFNISPGVYNIFVYNIEGKINPNVNNQITVSATTLITSTSINPSIVAPSYENPLFLSGNNFQTATRMYMQLKNSTEQIEITDYEASLFNNVMKFSLPQNLLEGEYDIFLVNDAGTSQPLQLTITNAPPVICFKENTKISCLQNNIETDIFIQNLKCGDLVKTYKHGYLPVNVVGKNICYNPKNAQRLKSRLFKLRKEKYPALKEDLIVTGCHSILESIVSQSKGEELMKVNKRIYTTNGLIRLPAYLDDRSEPYVDEYGDINVYHVALGNDEDRNYGIYANGLLVESCFIPRIKNEMTII